MVESAAQRAVWRSQGGAWWSLAALALVHLLGFMMDPLQTHQRTGLILTRPDTTARAGQPFVQQPSLRFPAARLQDSVWFSIKRTPQNMGLDYPFFFRSAMPPYQNGSKTAARIIALVSLLVRQHQTNRHTIVKLPPAAHGTRVADQLNASFSIVALRAARLTVRLPNAP